MPFAAFDFLRPVKADGGALGRRCATLAIHTSRGRLREPPLSLAFPVAPCGHKTLPAPRATPAPAVAIDRVAIAHIRGHHTPLAPGLVHIANAMEHAA